jgi:GMP synthase (glutamine-hydrolysing)
MTATIACLHHLDPRVLGHVEAPLRERGCHLYQCNVCNGDPLPGLADIHGLISFGGEQSAADLGRYPHLAAEVEFLADCVGYGIPVLGICLGAQLLALSCEGLVSPMPRRIRAWTPLARTPAAADDPLFSALDPHVTVMLSHNDSIQPPDGAVELLSRGGPGAAAFRAAPRAWGVQFHPEADDAALDEWVNRDRKGLAAGGIDPDRARVSDRLHEDSQRELAHALFGRFADLVVARARLHPGDPQPQAGRGSHFRRS